MPEPDEVTITPRDDGPYFVLGSKVKLLDMDGNPIPYKGRLALCRCGNSNTKPICDGTHRRTGFRSIIRA